MFFFLFVEVYENAMKKCRTFKVGTDKRFSLNLNPVVTILSACLIWALVSFCMIAPETANAQVCP